MVKLLGSVCILSGGMLARWCRVRERRLRLDTLSGLLAALRRMGEEIRLTRTPLPELLEGLAVCAGPAGLLFWAGAEAARTGGDLPAVWKGAAEELPISQEDQAALVELGESLHGDEESVCKAISLVISHLASSLEESRRRGPEEDKRATALCLSGAALLVILLI